MNIYNLYLKLLGMSPGCTFIHVDQLFKKIQNKSYIYIYKSKKGDREMSMSNCAIKHPTIIYMVKKSVPFSGNSVVFYLCKDNILKNIYIHECRSCTNVEAVQR